MKLDDPKSLVEAAAKGRELAKRCLPMTTAKERELVEKMAIELCYADFVAPIDYGGADYYWQNCVIAKRKEVYRRRATAALRIAAPILRNEALEEGAAHLNAEAQKEGNDDTAHTLDKAASAIRSLKTKGDYSPA